MTDEFRWESPWIVMFADVTAVCSESRWKGVWWGGGMLWREEDMQRGECWGQGEMEEPVAIPKNRRRRRIFLFFQPFECLHICPNNKQSQSLVLHLSVKAIKNTDYDSCS